MTVLPDLGEATIRPRWPLPIGAIISMMRPVLFSSPRKSRSRIKGVSGCSGVRFSNMILCFGLRRKTVDLVNLDQREIALAVFRRAHFALNRIAGMQIKAPDLRRADINIIRACQIGSFRRTQKPKPVGQNFKRAIAENGLASARAFFQNGKHQFLLRRRLALSISKRYAISINCDTCKDFSSDKCIELGREDGGKKIEKENRASARNSE